MKIYKYKDLSNRSHDMCQGTKSTNNIYYKPTNDDDTMINFWCYSSLEELLELWTGNQSLASIKDYTEHYEMTDLILVVRNVKEKYPEALI